jgi:metal-responsive CopG/Arc/MetJ family transcriptional regulator
MYKTNKKSAKVMATKERAVSNDKCETKRVSVSLPLDTIKKLDEIASRYGITMTDAIRRAIATEDYIESEIQADSKILIQKSDNTLREVVFR